jgi:solute carrier family 34 (sodium-dependent phosphate cotransporter)
MDTKRGAAVTPTPAQLSATEFWLRVAAVLGLLFLFLTAVTGLSNGFKLLGKDALAGFFGATQNPFLGLTIGILGTTLVQSSSVTTSMIVGLVASGSLDISAAVPMVMGANIGTTVTNTIVALGHVSRPAEFRRAFAAATCHDFFNFLAVALLLPLEMATGFLQRGASAIARGLAGTSGGEYPNPIKDATQAAIQPVEGILDAMLASERMVAIGLIVVSGLLIFSTLLLIVRTLRSIASARLEGIVARSLGKSPAIGIIVGIVVTVMVQSSSITTSVLVPLTGAGLIRLEQAFPITLGANIGTTVTALIASLASPPETLHLGLTIALVHLLFNACGVALIYVSPWTRQFPLRMARSLSEIAVQSRVYALIYVAALFYGLPALLVFVSRSL